MKNLPEFIALIHRYETITMKEIKESGVDPNRLTGFGERMTCKLCGNIYDARCEGCVYTDRGTVCITDETYGNIDNAKTAADLLKSYWLRAKYMRGLLKEKGIEI